ncbi:EamA family transporter [Collinsella sp. AF19-7AC]|uniref:EamA family transporter n=1 Tax=unclassified Collinsella TaxID=2637548 RepID=UPI000E452B13|nr:MULTISPECIES: EamA family transporter [unclassified Collinsella]RGJ52179.1 EamA family transporter [Collinsella sp. TM06-3]RGS93107.1 EamA family transporter [Collinsella sp. AF20-14LB]RGT06188.1 EamA family transporter [Collinsella sp. AF19-7AC]RGT33281.1 EamA family transporter [Collinsella sp. AF19-1LB]RGU67199.1 EamA family transporter [Collinsella sp. AF15-51]
MSWVTAAFASAFFAGITSILAKCGIRHTDSDVATAIRTCVVLVFAWAMAGISGSIGAIGAIPAKAWLFLTLSGLATGASWICYFKALSIGDVNKVVPVDKMSTVLAVLIAIVLFGETGNLAVKLVGTAVITLGTFLMIEKKQSVGAEQKQDRAWLAYALGAAVFAALTSVLAKIGIEGVESNLATAIRTCVVLVMAWAIVAAKGKLEQVARIDPRELAFLAASGIATGASWLLYYYAIAAGQVSVVVQIDKLSIVVSVLFARLAFNEKLSHRSAIGLFLIVLGTAALAIWK